MLREMAENIVEDVSKIDWIIIVIVSVLICFGIIMNLLATSNQIDPKQLSLNGGKTVTIVKDVYFNARSQVTKTIVGLLFGLICFRVPPKTWCNIHLNSVLLALSFLLLLGVLKWGVEINYATRWYKIFGVSFAPSDFARFSLILFSASFLNKYADKMQKFKHPLMLLGILAGIIIPILFQPNLSTVLVLSCIVGSMMWIAGIPKKWTVIILSLMITGVIIFSMNSFRAWRMKVWLDPHKHSQIAETLMKSKSEADSLKGVAINKVAFHQVMSLVAFNEGGINGVGGGNSMQKYYLPEAYSDSILSIIGEEFGMIGVIVVITLFGVFIYRGYSITARSRDTFSQFLAFGIVVNFSFYLIIHFFVNVAAMPATGLPLPFISAGGTAMFMNLGLLGILLRLSTQKGSYLWSESN